MWRVCAERNDIAYRRALEARVCVSVHRKRACSTQSLLRALAPAQVACASCRVCPHAACIDPVLNPCLRGNVVAAVEALQNFVTESAQHAVACVCFACVCLAHIGVRARACVCLRARPRLVEAGVEEGVGARGAQLERDGRLCPRA
eukprot:37556-Pleurochrysis_carterae.AAC.1